MIDHLKKAVATAIVLLYAGAMLAASEPIMWPQPPQSDQPEAKKGYVVLILGSTSVGKSTMSKRISGEITTFLENLRNHPDVTKIAMDDRIDDDDVAIPSAVRKEFPGWSEDHITMFKKIVAEATLNKVVVVDLMLFVSLEYDITESFITKLKEKTNVFSVLVYCSMDQLIENIVSRSSSSDLSDRRSPDVAVDQFCEQYLSQSPRVQEIDHISPSEIEQSIQTLSSSPIKIPATDRCVEILRKLHDRSPSPVTCNPQLYGFIIKNNEKSICAGIAKIWYALLKKILETYKISQ